MKFHQNPNCRGGATGMEARPLKLSPSEGRKPRSTGERASPSRTRDPQKSNRYAPWSRIRHKPTTGLPDPSHENAWTDRIHGGDGPRCGSCDPENREKDPTEVKRLPTSKQIVCRLLPGNEFVGERNHMSYTRKNIGSHAVIDGRGQHPRRAEEVRMSVAQQSEAYSTIYSFETLNEI